jgi:transposase
MDQFVGIDVSAKKLQVIVEGQQLLFENTAADHKKIIQRLTKKGRTAKVCMEATGNYGLDLALALDRAKGIEIMLVNPRASHHFALAMMKRSKTDPVDAHVLQEYGRRMDFVAWTPPEKEQLELRAYARRSVALTNMMTQEKNRLHAAESTAELAFIRNDMEVNIRHFKRRLEEIEKQQTRLIEGNSQLQEVILHLTSVKGIAFTSATQIYAELCVLPSGMTPRQWVAHAGLDPRHHESGTLIGKTRISKRGNKYLRRALYMPALSGAQHDPHMKAFYEKLVNNGKAKMQALVAVMRKLLHAIHGMLRHDADFDGQKFYKLSENA